MAPRSRMPILVMGTLSICAVLTGCSPSSATSAPAPRQAATVVVKPPEKSLVEEFLDYTARIEPAQKVEVRSRLSGYLQAIRFRDGQHVQAGAPLFEIDRRPFVAVRDRARASLAQAAARQKFAAEQLKRISRMQQSGASSKEDLDRVQHEFDTAQAAVTLAEAELRGAELELSYTTVRAPIAGKVSDRRVDVGNYVAGASAQGGVLTTIVAQRSVRAVVELSEADFHRLQQQGRLPTRVRLSLDGLDAARSAAVDFLDNEISARSGTVRLRARMDNPDAAMLPGSFAKVRIPVGEPRERLLVPDAAVQTDQSKKFVLIVDAGNQVAPKRVQVGGLVGDKRVVLSGLAAEDRIIVSGQQRVRPGDRVQVETAKGS